METLSEKSSVRVAVRVRPLNRRERGTKSITKITNSSITLTNPTDRTKKKKKFSFDFLYDTNTKQVQLYNDIGKRVINNAFKGYNSCVFAYGLTGCFAYDTPIMMLDGSYHMVQNIKLGDKLMGDDSTERNVVKLFKGRQEMFTVHNTLGYESYTVNIDHIMVFKNNLNKIIEMSICDYLKLSNESKSLLYCIVNRVSFASQPAPDPYPKGINIGNTLDYIPDKYKYNDRRTRLHVLAGLIDSIGSVHGSSFLVKCRLLSEDVLFLSRSLGFHAVYNGTHCVISGDLNLIPVILTDLPTTLVDDSTELSTKYLPLITSVGVGEYYGFMLDGNHRFIGAGFNVLRNSGKSFSMMGDQDHPGLIPRICQSLFTQQSNHNDNTRPNCSVSYRVELSYLEIYSEQVIDLMDATNTDLKVRQHPDYGPYVENLTQLLVEDYTSIKRIIDRGNKGRHVASTLMNNRSSRSHAILTVYFTQIVLEGNITREVVSKINLVDLAGSERVDASGVTGINFQEAIQINKSLSTLGLVISKLAAKAKSKANKTKVVKPRGAKSSNPNHIPFRDSVLTWILKESLGGNSKTYMIATISPSSGNFNESLSTLRYASNAKQIINTVKINEDPNDKIIRVLRDEINLLRNKLTTKRESGVLNSPEIRFLREELKQREELMKEKEKSWSDKLNESREVRQRAKIRHEEELAIKQAEYKEKLEHMDAQRSNLLSEVEVLKTTMSDQEIIQQKQRDEFEKKKIVETAVSLQEYYEKRLSQAQVEYETKAKNEAMEIKAQLVKTQKDLQLQTVRINTERAVLNKQIQQLKSKIKSLESKLKDPSVQLHAYNAIKAKKDAEEQKYILLQHNYEQLLIRISNAQKTLDDLR